MTTLVSVGINTDASLNDLQTIVQQQEGTLGPLVAFGNGELLAADGTTEQRITTVVCDTDQDSPVGTKRAVLQLASAPSPAGTTPICTGDCYVSGQITKVAAYRPQ